MLPLHSQSAESTSLVWVWWLVGIGQVLQRGRGERRLAGLGHCVGQRSLTVTTAAIGSLTLGERRTPDWAGAVQDAARNWPTSGPGVQSAVSLSLGVGTQLQCERVCHCFCIEQ